MSWGPRIHFSWIPPPPPANRWWQRLLRWVLRRQIARWEELDRKDAEQRRKEIIDHLRGGARHG